MARGFGTGLVWGLVVMGAGLVVLSQLAPVPGTPPEPAPVDAEAPSDAGGVTPEVAGEADEAEADAALATAEAAKLADKAAAEEAAKVAADKAAAEEAAKVAADAAAKVAAEEAAKLAADKAAAKRLRTGGCGQGGSDKAAADKAAADKAAAAAAEEEKARADTAARHKVATEMPPVAEVPGEPPTPPLAGDESPEAISTNDVAPVTKAPGDGGEVPSLAGLGQALIEPEGEAAPAPVEPAPVEPEGPRDDLSVPGQPVGQDEPQRLPQIAPAVDPDLMPEPPEVVAEPSEDPSPESSPGVAVEERPTALPAVKPLEDKLPTTVLDKSVPGVTTDGLPQIGAEAIEPAAEAVAADLPPIKRFARAFVPEGRPLFVILLQDVGAAGMARDELVKLPFAVSFVIDPLATDAAEASAAYRAAGQEVLTLANGIPMGAEASDLETTFATLSSILSESVAIVDQDLGGFQDQRPLATLVLPVIKGEGRGLVTYDRGLNAADQIAQREGVPAALIYRRLDGEGEGKPVIRRYLDRAAFKAAQEGAVVVIGDTRADTVAAILEWTIEGKAATVTLAPVTAVMK